ncbi:uncharacterized protein LOC110980745 [Acanthaster planci]|uniref:Uncharacterized protein LOC110980745 n=1 Tax=Acanthaster planci TaxID=133434 RepID=A0A8B7YPM1_ACAPL|nr:uncharacterized protein LOC110980745 [Acanthaster planci]
MTRLDAGVEVLGLIIFGGMVIFVFGDQCNPLSKTKYAAENCVLQGFTYAHTTVRSRVTCERACSLDGRCKSFNFNDCNKTCELNLATRREHPRNFTAAQGRVYFDEDEETPRHSPCDNTCTYFDAVPGWRLVFRGVAGRGMKLSDMWTAACGDPGVMATAGSCRDDSLHEAWRSGALAVRWVKLSLCDFIGCRAELIFDGTGSDILNWFTKDRLISSPWKDLNSSSEINFFGIEGDVFFQHRRFFINHKYGSCPWDYGWLIVVDSLEMNGCDWERSQAYPIILCSTAEGYVRWEDAVTGGSSAAIARADYLTIHIDAE